MKPSVKKTLQIAVSSILFVLLFYWIDFEQLKESLSKANYIYLCAALILILINRTLMPVKWNLLLKVKDIHVPLFDVIKIYFISSFLGIYLPPTIGSDMVRAYYVRKRKYELSDIISSIVVERLLGLIALLMFGILGCFLFANYFANVTFDLHRILFLTVVVIILVITGFFISLSQTFGRILQSFFNRFSNRKLIGKILKQIDKFYQSYALYKTRKGILFAFFLLTCIEVALPIIRSYLVAAAFQVTVPLLYFFAFVPIIILLIRLPISFDGFGIQEGGFMYFFALIGVSKTLGFSIGLLNHIIFLIGITPGAIFYAFERGVKESYQELQRPTA